MNQHQVGIPLLQSLAGGFAAVRGAIVHNPENPLGLPVRFLAHDLLDQAVEWSDAGSRVTADWDVRRAGWGGCGLAPECWFSHRLRSRIHRGPRAVLASNPGRDPVLVRPSARTADRGGKSNCGVAKGEWHLGRASARWWPH